MIEPTQIIEETDQKLSIKWSDDTKTEYLASELRKACPCAGCVNEWTGEKILKDETIPDDLTFSDISIVGRYALNFHFSDGHENGIYSFKFLREMGNS